MGNTGEWFGFDAGDRPASPDKGFKDIMTAIKTYLPDFANRIRAEIPKFADVETRTQEKYAPRQAVTENRLKNIQLQGEKNRFITQGNPLIDQVSATSRRVNPDFYTNQSQVASNLRDLMRPGLTGGETESIARGLRAVNVGRGNDRMSSSTNTISNAITFGNAARDRMERATQLAGSLNPTLQNMSPESIFNIGTGKSASAPAVNTNAAQDLATGMWGSGTNLKSTGMNVLGQRNTNFLGAAEPVNKICGCYIFRAHYGVEIPWWVVFARDYFHEQNPMLGHGYKKMAKWLVPLMKKFGIVRKLVEYTMIRPLTIYGGYMYNVVGFEGGWIFKPIVKMWFNIWKKS